MRPLVWLRSDLRTRDNHALRHACRESRRGVVAAFLTAPRQWREHDWGANKVDFILRNVAALSHELESLNIPLLIRETPTFDDAPEALLGIAREHECDALLFNREYEVNEARRDDAVRAAFEEDGRDVRSFTDQVIVGPDRLRTSEDEYYKVFSPYRRAWIALLKDEGVPERLSRPSKRSTMPTKPDAVPSEVAGFGAPSAPPDLWPAGEREARARLERFIERRIDEYNAKRDFPAIEATSRLSPYLSAGAISPRQCLAAALEVNQNKLDSGKKGVAAWISELAWREFYRHILVGFPRVCMRRPFRLETEALRWSDDQDAFERWKVGRTGYPIVDAGMRQLQREGWMHNRLRMIVAMFLSKHLWLDWRWGERHFMNHLVDGDLASNNGGWQWSASTGVDAAPYFRIFNPSRQSERFDPNGEFIREFVPELAEVEGDGIHEPAKIGRLRSDQLDYPKPMVDQKAARQAAIEAFQAIKD